MSIGLSVLHRPKGTGLKDLNKRNILFHTYVLLLYFRKRPLLLGQTTSDKPFTIYIHNYRYLVLLKAPMKKRRCCSDKRPLINPLLVYMPDTGTLTLTRPPYPVTLTLTWCQTLTLTIRCQTLTQTLTLTIACQTLTFLSGAKHHCAKP